MDRNIPLIREGLSLHFCHQRRKTYNESIYPFCMEPHNLTKEIEVPKLNVVQTFFIGFGFMSCMFAWAVYTFYLPRILKGHLDVNGDFVRVGIFRGDLATTWTSIVMIIDNVAAILIQPYFGDLSDRLESKLGRRTPFLLIGIPLAAISMIFMPFAIQIGPLALLLTSFIGLVLIFNIGMAIYRAPVVALMPDLTPSKHRSIANVIINVMGGLGSVLGMYIPIILAGIPFVEKRTIDGTSYQFQDFFVQDCAVFWGSALILILILGFYLIFVKEVPTGDKFWNIGTHTIKFDADTLERLPPTDKELVTEKFSMINELKLIFRADEKSPKYMFLSLFFWTLCNDVFSTYYSTWGPAYARLEDNALGQISIISSVVLIILSYPAAIISNKKGRIWTMKLGGICFVLAFSLMLIFQEVGKAGYTQLAVIGIVTGICINTLGGAILGIAAITITWQLAPENKVGTYTGLYYLFKQMGAILSPILFGLIFDLIKFLANGDEVIGWIALMPYCLLFALMFNFTFYKVKKGEVGDTWDPNEKVTAADVMDVS